MISFIASSAFLLKVIPKFIRALIANPVSETIWICEEMIKILQKNVHDICRSKNEQTVELIFSSIIGYHLSSLAQFLLSILKTQLVTTLKQCQAYSKLTR